MLFSIKGYIRIKFSGENISLFLNECHKRSYVLNNIKKSEDTYYADVKSIWYSSIISLADEYNITVCVNGRFGILMKLIVYKGRKAFFALMAFLALYYGINSCFVSEISIQGNKIFSDTQILRCLSDNGLEKGSLKFGIDPEKFQNEFIKKFPGISWIWLEIDGTKAIVSVREKVTKPDFHDDSFLCNVVAAKDGVIKNAISSSGTLLVSEGMFVKKGDILISGVYDFTDLAPIRFVNSGGIVNAATNYSIEDTFTCSFVKYYPASDLKTSLSAKLFDTKLFNDKLGLKKSIILPEDDIKFKIFGKKYLPLAFTKLKYCEIIKEKYTLSKEDAIKHAEDELYERLCLEIPGEAEIVNTKKDVTHNPDGSFTLKLSFECIEDIVAYQPIEVEMQ